MCVGCKIGIVQAPVYKVNCAECKIGPIILKELYVTFTQAFQAFFLGAAVQILNIAARCVCVPICFISGNPGCRNGQWVESIWR